MVFAIVITRLREAKPRDLLLAHTITLAADVCPIAIRAIVHACVAGVTATSPSCPRSGRNHFEPSAKRWVRSPFLYLPSP